MTTHTQHETRIEADDRLPAIHITREFDAPPAAVYRAHVDPELVAQWLGPADTEMTVDVWDARDGGEFRFVHRTPDRGTHGFRGCFHRLVDGVSVVQTFTYEGDPDGVALERLTLEPLDGGRTRLVATSLCESFEGRDQWLASGMEQGVSEGYQQLDALLADA